MAFLPLEFVVPATLVTERWKMRSININDVVKDFDAVMSSRDHLRARFGDIWGWPSDDWTLEQNLVHLGWHQHEFVLRSSFDYAVMSLDDSRLLGCVYVDPPYGGAPGIEAEVWFWGRQSELASGLEGHMETVLRSWLASHWPFKRVLFQGQALDV